MLPNRPAATLYVYAWLESREFDLFHEERRDRQETERQRHIAADKISLCGRHCCCPRFLGVSHHGPTNIHSTRETKKFNAELPMQEEFEI